MEREGEGKNSKNTTGASNVVKLDDVLKKMFGDMIAPKILSEGFCEGCQQPYKLTELITIGGVNKGKPFTFKKGCICEDLKLARQTAEAHKNMEERKKLDEFESVSLIPADLKNANFDNFKPNHPSQEIALQKMIDYAQGFRIDDPRNIILGGDTGRGKSHLGVAVARSLMVRKYSTIFISVPRMLRQIRNTYGEGGRMSEELFHKLESADFLVLDDIGQERNNLWAVELLYDLIDSRLGKHTFFTTNKSSQDLLDHLGSAILSRMKRNLIALKIEGRDMR